MAKKLTNKELLTITIDEELLLFGNWLLKNSNATKFLNQNGCKKSIKEILEMYKKENP